MTKKPFQANSWLNSNQSLLHSTQQSAAIPPLPEDVSTIVDLYEKATNSFSPNNFLVPGWRGDSLKSKATLAVEKIRDLLISDALVQFDGFHNRNKSMKMLVFHEFMSFTNSRGINCFEIDNYNTFWMEVLNENSSNSALLKEFKDIYCFRLVTTYLYKVRFFTTLSRDMKLKLKEKDYLNPNSFLAKFFKTGSSTELKCDALKANQYSWYRPHSSLSKSISDLDSLFSKISVTEMMKLCLHDSEKADCSKFSHSLSHKAFGLLMNLLLIKFPQWIKKDDKESPPSFLPFIESAGNLRNAPQILNSKYVGANLKALTHSHWLAQENNVNTKWSEIISPDFLDDDFINGQYTKICHELQFLTFLVRMARTQGYHPIHLICTVLNDKHSKAAVNGEGQISMFSGHDTTNEEVSYNRIILNLSDLPKKNPHHFLLTQINTQYKSLQSNGLVYVFSNQKLFVPSQSVKVEQLLVHFKVEGRFNFENLKGKGEIPGHLYILSKREKQLNENLITNFNRVKKESCLNFNWRGNLSRFDKFQSFVEELDQFFGKTNSLTTPVYQKEISEELSFEFHQDAIVEGKLLSANAQNSSNLTHPNFFKNLTKTCVPLSQFFQIESLSQETSTKNSMASELLGIHLKQEEKYPLMLIADYSNQTDIRIELASTESYKAKVEQYGIAYFQYFGLVPKRTDININVFREFFNTALGKQIIQLSLNGGYTKVKSKLNTLLIPKFFLFTSEMPAHIEVGLKFFKTDKDELMTIHPDQIASQFTNLEQITLSIGSKYPWQMMGILSHHKHNLEDCLSDLDRGTSSSKGQIKFDNPLIIENILKVPTKEIYPKNEDVFISTPISDPAMIHMPLDEIRIETVDGNHSLNLISSGQVIVQLFSDISLLKFIKFILTSAAGHKISEILQNLAVPSISDINNVLDSYNGLKGQLQSQKEKTQSLITQVLATQINGITS